MRQLNIALAGLAAACLLAACGGGGGQPAAEVPQAAHEVPASATASPTAYTQFAGTLAQSDTALPLEMQNVAVPPTSETAAPMDL